MKRSCTAFHVSSNTVQEHEPTEAECSSSMRQHHVILERKRREKLNESFHILRSLIPSGIKKDKATVLSAAIDYLTCLSAQVSELSKKNQTLEQHVVFPQRSTSSAQVSICDSSIQRLINDIGIRHNNNNDNDNGEEESRSWNIEAEPRMKMIDLQVIKMGEGSMLDMVVRLLEFLKEHDQNMSLISIEASTALVDSSPVNRVILRLQILGVKWEESDFQEAITRLVTQ